jgi:hypothetical protein
MRQRARSPKYPGCGIFSLYVHQSAAGRRNGVAAKSRAGTLGISYGDKVTTSSQRTKV